MKKNILLSLLVLWSLSMIAADNIVSGFVIDRNGTIKFDDIAMRLSHFNEKWSLAVQNGNSIRPLEGYPATQGGAFELQAKWNLRDGRSFDLTEKLSKLGESAFSYRLKLNSS